MSKWKEISLLYYCGHSTHRFLPINCTLIYIEQLCVVFKLLFWRKRTRQSERNDGDNYTFVRQINGMKWNERNSPLTRAAFRPKLIGSLIQNFQHLTAATTHTDRLLWDYHFVFLKFSIDDCCLHSFSHHYSHGETIKKSIFGCLAKKKKNNADMDVVHCISIWNEMNWNTTNITTVLTIMKSFGIICLISLAKIRRLRREI